MADELNNSGWAAAHRPTGDPGADPAPPPGRPPGVAETADLGPGLLGERDRAAARAAAAAAESAAAEAAARASAAIAEAARAAEQAEAAARAADLAAEAALTGPSVEPTPAAGPRPAGWTGTPVGPVRGGSPDRPDGGERGLPPSGRPSGEGGFGLPADALGGGPVSPPRELLDPLPTGPDPALPTAADALFGALPAEPGDRPAADPSGAVDRGADGVRIPPGDPTGSDRAGSTDPGWSFAADPDPDRNGHPDGARNGHRQDGEHRTNGHSRATDDAVWTEPGRRRSDADPVTQEMSRIDPADLLGPVSPVASSTEPLSPVRPAGAAPAGGQNGSRREAGPPARHGDESGSAPRPDGAGTPEQPGRAAGAAGRSAAEAGMRPPVNGAAPRPDHGTGRSPRSAHDADPSGRSSGDSDPAGRSVRGVGMTGWSAGEADQGTRSGPVAGSGQRAEHRRADQGFDAPGRAADRAGRAARPGLDPGSPDRRDPGAGSPRARGAGGSSRPAGEAGQQRPAREAGSPEHPRSDHEVGSSGRPVGEAGQPWSPHEAGSAVWSAPGTGAQMRPDQCAERPHAPGSAGEVGIRPADGTGPSARAGHEAGLLVRRDPGAQGSNGAAARPRFADDPGTLVWSAHEMGSRPEQGADRPRSDHEGDPRAQPASDAGPPARPDHGTGLSARSEPGAGGPAGESGPRTRPGPGTGQPVWPIQEVGRPVHPEGPGTPEGPATGSARSSAPAAPADPSDPADPSTPPRHRAAESVGELTETMAAVPPQDDDPSVVTAVILPAPGRSARRPPHAETPGPDPRPASLPLRVVPSGRSDDTTVRPAGPDPRPTRGPGAAAGPDHPGRPPIASRSTPDGAGRPSGGEGSLDRDTAIRPLPPGPAARPTSDRGAAEYDRTGDVATQGFPGITDDRDRGVPALAESRSTGADAADRVGRTPFGRRRAGAADAAGPGGSPAGAAGRGGAAADDVAGGSNPGAATRRGKADAAEAMDGDAAGGPDTAAGPGSADALGHRAKGSRRRRSADTGTLPDATAPSDETGSDAPSAAGSAADEASIAIPAQRRERRSLRGVLAVAGAVVLLGLAGLVATLESRAVPEPTAPVAATAPTTAARPTTTATATGAAADAPLRAAVDPQSRPAAAYLDTLRRAEVPVSRTGLAETEAAEVICRQLENGIDQATMTRAVPAVLTTVTADDAPTVVKAAEDHYCSQS